MTPRAPLDQPADGQPVMPAGQWCGHRGGYRVTAFLCGRGQASDQIVQCAECGASYLASDLDTYRRNERTPAMPAPSNSKPAQPKREQAPATTYKDIGPGSVSGNITHELALRYTPQGRAVVTMRVAETERVQDSDTGEWIDLEPQFWDVIAWGQMGENAMESLAKGNRVVASGRWQEQAWTDKEGQERTKTVLVARDVGPSLLFVQAAIRKPERQKGR